MSVVSGRTTRIGNGRRVLQAHQRRTRRIARSSLCQILREGKASSRSSSREQDRGCPAADNARKQQQAEHTGKDELPARQPPMRSRGGVIILVLLESGPASKCDIQSSPSIKIRCAYRATLPRFRPQAMRRLGNYISSIKDVWKSCQWSHFFRLNSSNYLRNMLIQFRIQ